MTLPRRSLPDLTRRSLRAVLYLLLTIVSAPAAMAQPLDLGGGDGLIGRPGKIRFTSMVTPANAAVGDSVELRIIVELPAEHYIYSTNPETAAATKITLNVPEGLEPIDAAFTADHQPKREFDPNLEAPVEKFFDGVVWSRKFRVTVAAAGTSTFTGKIAGQYCGPRTCTPLIPPHEFAAVLTVGAGSAPAPMREQPFSITTRPELRGKPGHAEVSFSLAPPDAAPGEPVELRLHLKLDEKWHTYATTQTGPGAVPTSIDVSSVFGLKPIDEGFTPDRVPKLEQPLPDEQPDLKLQSYYEHVTWTRNYVVADDAVAGQYGAEGSIRYQLCDDRGCLPPKTVSFALGVLPEVPTAAPEPSAPVVVSEDEDVNVSASQGQAPNQLIPFLITAFIAGFVALLTPCVFPMVPITVSFFLKQAEHQHHRPLTMAVAYCVGIVVTFTGLGLLMSALFGATALNQLVTNPWLNLAIAAVFIFFGLNLLGMFEIRVPSFLLNYTAGHEGKGGLLGVLFMALTFTLTSFTCTFAFAGGLLVLAANGEYYWPILGMLAFSTAFALPFFFLALFPSWLKKLPKSGGWMNAVKVTMGLIEIGAAVKFLSVADVAWNPSPIVFDFSMVMICWVIISALIGLYLLGSFRLPHDMPQDSISVLRLLFAAQFLGLAAYIGNGLFAPPEKRPSGWLWAQIEAFGPPNLKAGEGPMGPFVEHDGLQFALDFDRAVPYAAKVGRPLFLDFTGVNCVNCRLMEARWKQPANHSRLEKLVGVQLFVDDLPTVKDPVLAERLLERNRKLQEKWMGDVTLPSYAVASPDGKTILATFAGLESETGQFAAFLDDGLRKWQQLQAGKPVDEVRIGQREDDPLR